MTYTKWKSNEVNFFVIFPSFSNPVSSCTFMWVCVIFTRSSLHFSTWTLVNSSIPNGWNTQGCRPVFTLQGRAQFGVFYFLLPFGWHRLVPLVRIDILYREKMGTKHDATRPFHWFFLFLCVNFLQSFLTNESVSLSRNSISLLVARFVLVRNGSFPGN